MACRPPRSPCSAGAAATLRLIHRALGDKGIPVEVVGLGGLLEMPEVADVVAVLEVLADPTANAALARILTGPRYRVGPRDLKALGSRAARLAQAAPSGRSRRAGRRPGAGARPSTRSTPSTSWRSPTPWTTWASRRPTHPRATQRLDQLRRRAGRPSARCWRSRSSRPWSGSSPAIGLDVEIEATPSALAAGAGSQPERVPRPRRRFRGHRGRVRPLRVPRLPRRRGRQGARPRHRRGVDRRHRQADDGAQGQGPRVGGRRAAGPGQRGVPGRQGPAAVDQAGRGAAPCSCAAMPTTCRCWPA